MVAYYQTSFLTFIESARFGKIMRALPKPARMEKIARAWRPWCSVASWYLWRSLDGEAAL
jgi:3-methyladenine DNA glycosylase/8-oxoguanine DNA glycosylase